MVQSKEDSSLSIFSTIQIEEEVKLQSSILSSIQYIKTPIKVSIKVQRIIGTLSSMSI